MSANKGTLNCTQMYLTQLFQTEKEIYQNILRGYVEGNEWFLNNIKPLLSDQRTVRSKIGDNLEG